MKPRSKSEWMTPAALRRGVAGVDRPGAHFLLAGGEVGPQAEQVIGGADQRADAALLHAQLLRGTASPSSGERSTRSLSICALIDDGLARRGASSRSRGTLTTYGIGVRGRQVASFTLQAKIVGLSVSRKNCRGDALAPRAISSTVRAGLPASRCVSSFASTASSAIACLVAALGVLGRRVSRRFVHRLEVGEHQLGVDDLDVAHRVDRCRTRGACPRPRSSAPPGRWRPPRGCG